MINYWNDSDLETVSSSDDLSFRVYSSRLLGRDKSLVLHGGGNTSVKIAEKNRFGEVEEILYVKGSGWDLEVIEGEGFSPVRLKHLKKLSGLPSLSDPEMVNELRSNMTQATAPTPSVEAILHAIIPFKYVDHTHADAVVTITNTAGGTERIQQVFGNEVIVVPYVMPGFDLARLCSERLDAEMSSNIIGMVLMNHGVFSFGSTAKESYDRMIYLVNKAEQYLQSIGAWNIPVTAEKPEPEPDMHLNLAKLRRDISNAAEWPVIMRRYISREIMSFVSCSDLALISQQGPATPDHVIRTKRLPMIGSDVNAYVLAYKDYFSENNALAREQKIMLDTAPRVVLDPKLGMCTVGRSAKDAGIVADIYKHTISIIQRSEMVGGYRSLPAKDIFDVEYWDLEQAKLKKAGRPALFAGEIALVTGAASGIGKACVNSLLKRGAAVIGVDINPAVESLSDQPGFLGLVADVTSESSTKDVIAKAIDAFGGLDMLILNAGIFPTGCNVSELTLSQWKKVMAVNLDSGFTLMSAAYPYIKLAPKGGRVVIVGSKNVPAPGPGAAAYSASKAALNQLARVAALEWGGNGIRVNSVHPNAVFDTGIWTEEVLASRAKHYGLTVDEYKKNNVLKTEVTSLDVAELVAEMCGPLFSKTTGSQIPVDGGNDRVI